MAEKSALGQTASQKFAELRLGFWCRGHYTPQQNSTSPMF
jgi:hypothetical protein